jgi:hypothetical protein
MPNGVQFYSTHLKNCTHSQLHKASLFVAYGCIKYDNFEKCYYCLPLNKANGYHADYNSTTYYLKKNESGEVECDCQHCTQRIRAGLSPNCSHIDALHLHWELLNKKNGTGPYKQGTLVMEVRV